MTTIFHIVESQRRFKNRTPLGGCLGDGFLYIKNPLFQSLRNECLKLGLKFAEHPNTSYYEVCPHLALHEIVSSKTVPYFKNAPVLRRMHKLYPSLSVNGILEIKKNKVLHESAHFFAASVLRANLFKHSTPKFRREFVLATVVCESFASSCETVGRVFINDPIHAWMYGINTNIFGCEKAEYQELLRQVANDFGLKFCFKLSMLSFLYWNFSFNYIDANHLSKLLSLFGHDSHLDDPTRKMLLEFSNYHFHVRDWFRKEVASFYFKSAGIAGDLTELLDFDFLSHLNSRDWSNKMTQLANVIPEETL